VRTLWRGLYRCSPPLLLLLLLLRQFASLVILKASNCNDTMMKGDSRHIAGICGLSFNPAITPATLHSSSALLEACK